MTTIVFQTLSFIVCPLQDGFCLGSWVWSTNRTITVPQRIGEIELQGVDGKGDSLARALAYGIAGAVAEHYRTVESVNQATRTANVPIIATSVIAPEPLLVRAETRGEPLNINVEFAGALAFAVSLSEL